MTLADLRAKADPILVDFWIDLKKKQDVYFEKHGKYFQLLITPTTTVADGIDSDFTARKPSDEVYTADVDFAWTTKLPFQIEVHEWVGPKNKGYQVVVTATVEKEVYQRTRDSQNNDSGWFKATTI